MRENSSLGVFSVKILAVVWAVGERKNQKELNKSMRNQTPHPIWRKFCGVVYIRNL